MTSDYRGLPRTTEKSPQNDSPNHASYSTVTSTQFPKKEHSIVIESREDIHLNDYIIAVGDIVGPPNVRGASKISNNRVCIFLANKEIFERLTNTHQQITINNIKLDIRPLMTKHKRITLSNVYPSIPHTTIEEALDKLNIRRGSPMSFLKVGIQDSRYAHVVSFRRQIYIHPEDIDKLTGPIQINHDDTNYWIYPSTDNLKCFACKKEGHISKNCPENPTGKNTTEMTNRPTEDHTRPTGSPLLMETNETSTTTIKTNTGIKRPRSETSSIISQTINTEVNIDKQTTTDKPPKEKKKAKKTTNSSEPKKKSLEEMIAPIKPILEEPNKFMNYLQLKSFLEKAKGSTHPTEIAREYTEDIEGLIAFMKEELYEHLNDRCIKHRFTRITNRLIKSNTGAQIESPYASSSEEDTTNELKTNN